MKIITNKKILRIETEGTLDVRPLFNADMVDRTVQEFLGSGEPLFPLELFPENRRDNVRVFLDPFRTITHLEGGGYIQRDFKRGNMTDYASVPGKLRSLVDNDDPRILLPALNHDGDYLTHLVDFKTANRLFYRSIRICGGGPYFATKAFLPVASPIGKVNYNRNKNIRLDVHQFVDIIARGQL